MVVKSWLYSLGLAAKYSIKASKEDTNPCGTEYLCSKTFIAGKYAFWRFGEAFFENLSLQADNNRLKYWSFRKKNIRSFLPEKDFVRS